MNDLKVGDFIKDNDPRMKWRSALKVTEILNSDQVRAETPDGNAFTIARRRIFTDGKPRRSGFSLITPKENA